ncbi:Rha family transcriptional regulator, partial [Pseudomonas aeruginosa]
MSLITTTNAVTMSSREIAELTGKRHDNVIADIRKMLLELGYQIDADGRSPDFSGDVPDAYGRLQHCFNLPRREVEILLTGYSIPLRAKCLDRLHELEARAKQTLPALPGDYIQALEHLLESKRSEQKAIEERDHAIATKAEIGSRREATAMASAS